MLIVIIIIIIIFGYSVASMNLSKWHSLVSVQLTSWRRFLNLAHFLFFQDKRLGCEDCKNSEIVDKFFTEWQDKSLSLSFTLSCHSISYFRQCTLSLCFCPVISCEMCHACRTSYTDFFNCNFAQLYFIFKILI